MIQHDVIYKQQKIDDLLDMLKQLKYEFGSDLIVSEYEIQFVKERPGERDLVINRAKKS